ncbi:MAG: TlpA disulfide reductase family protein [Acidimicrobiales bacterium]
MAKGPTNNPGSPSSGDQPMGVKIAIGVALVVVLAAIVVFAVKDSGGEKVNTVAFQNATITGASLPAMPDGEAVPSSDPAVGQTIPTVVGKTFDGSTVEIKPGKAQLIAIIAHWCPHCQKEVPLIVGWQKSGEITKDLHITAVSTAAEEAKGNYPPASWLDREEWKNPVLVDTPTSKVLSAFGATGFPTLIAVTADGKVAQRASGELTLDQVKVLVNAALGKKPDSTATTVPGTTPITSPVPTSAP